MAFEHNYILCSDRSCSTISGLLGLKTIGSGRLEPLQKRVKPATRAQHTPLMGVRRFSTFAGRAAPIRVTVLAHKKRRYRALIDRALIDRALIDRALIDKALIDRALIDRALIDRAR